MAREVANEIQDKQVHDEEAQAPKIEFKRTQMKRHQSSMPMETCNTLMNDQSVDADFE